MKLGSEILKLLNKIYQPETLIQTKFKRYDIAFKTDHKGRPVLLFIGQVDAQGNIRGERFSRTLKEGSTGEILKDHWDNKGKAT